MSGAHPAARLDRTSRAAALRRLASTRYDVLVVGGGVTGAGVALDAVTRGLSVGLVEMRDWAAGTSSRSGKLIHGGLRYLEQRDFGLVREALRERSLMLERLCPHLVKPLQFIYPLRHRVWERGYIGAGLLLYDTMGGAGAVPRHRHLSRRVVRSLAPGVRPDDLTGGLTFYDAQVDDARHTLELVRTAAAHGADVASAARVVGLRTEGARVVGAWVRDTESGDTFDVSARHVVNATGVWSDGVQRLAGGRPTLSVQAAKGVHILVPRPKIDARVSMFVRAEDSVLIIRMWGRHWLIGTTDTAWSESLDHPAPTSQDIDYLLRNLNHVLEMPLTLEDINGAYAGLRPLVSARASSTSKISREHSIDTPVPGFTTIAGGKYTTYRVMAKDVVDDVVRARGVEGLPSRTEDVPLLGAIGIEWARLDFSRSAARLGLTEPQIEHLLGRYGSLVRDLDALMAIRPDLARPIAGAPDYLRVEAVYAATHEGALHLDDVLTRRTHIAIETLDRGVSAADEVASLMAAELGWDPATRDAEVEHYQDRVRAEVEAARQPDDRAAMAVRDAVRDPRL